MQKLIVVTAAFVAFAVPALASDRGRTTGEQRPSHSREAGSQKFTCAATQSGDRMSITQVTAKLKAQGFTIQKIEDSRGCYEARVIDDTGSAIKLHLDAATGEIVNRRERN